MIARLWRGWTSRENADAYERLLHERVLPGLKRLDGYRGGYILRQESSEEVEFVVMNLFESLEAVQAFAGTEYTVPVFEPEARQLLSKVEPIAHHYEVKTAPEWKRDEPPLGG
jgi:heme-degrading monooxygenase HmoA